jgi:lipopolysaccharide export system protein LptA
VQLRNTHAYNLIRVLRAVIPIVVIVLVAIPVWNYVTRRAARTSAVDPLRGLVEGVREVSEGIQYAETEDGRSVFTVEAESGVLADGRRLLEGVQITIAGQDASTPARLIDSDDCDHDEETGNIACIGNIEIHFDEETVIQTTDMEYNRATEVIRALRSVHVVRPGAFEVDAERLALRLADDVLELNGGVRMTTEGGVTLSVDGARYYETENRIELFGGIRLRSHRGEIRSRTADVNLIPETLDPRQVVFRGSVTASSSDSENPLFVGADSLQVNLTGPQLEQVAATGAARIESSAGVLFGNDLTGHFSDVGELGVVDAVGNARMVFGDGYELRSDSIRNEVTDSILRSTSGSTLDLGEFQIEGSEFLIRQRETIEFSTERTAVITSPSGLLSAPNTTAAFDPESGELTQLLQTGGARFSRDGLGGNAERLSLGPDGWITMTGVAHVVEEGQLQIDGDEILLHEDGARFEASGSVRAVLTGDGLPVLIEGDRAAGDRSRITFYSSAGFVRENMQVTASTSIEFRPGEGRLLAYGDVASTLGEVRVWADTLDFDDAAGRVLYSGAVRGRFPDADVDADEVEVFLSEGDLDRVVARRAVSVRSAEIVGHGDEAEYEQSAGTITLTGTNATVRSPEMGLSTGPLFVWNVGDDRAVVTGDEDNRAVSRRTVESR